MRIIARSFWIITYALFQISEYFLAYFVFFCLVLSYFVSSFVSRFVSVQKTCPIGERVRTFPQSAYIVWILSHFVSFLSLLLSQYKKLAFPKSVLFCLNFISFFVSFFVSPFVSVRKTCPIGERVWTFPHSVLFCPILSLILSPFLSLLFCLSTKNLPDWWKSLNLSAICGSRRPTGSRGTRVGCTTPSPPLTRSRWRRTSTTPTKLCTNQSNSSQVRARVWRAVCRVWVCICCVVVCKRVEDVLCVKELKIDLLIDWF